MAGRYPRRAGDAMAIDGRSRLGPRLRETLSRITEEAASLLGVEGAGLRLVQGDELVRVAAYGPEGAVMVRERLRLGESLSGRVAASGRPVIVAGPDDEPGEDRWSRGPGTGLATGWGLCASGWGKAWPERSRSAAAASSWTTIAASDMPSRSSSRRAGRGPSSASRCSTMASCGA